MKHNFQFYTNGFLIKRLDSNYGKKFTKFFGIEGDTWPINNDIEGIILEKAQYLYIYIDENVQKSMFENDVIEVCNDVSFLNKYIQACNKLNYKIEILLCETERKRPILNLDEEKLKKNFVFLGYDYGYPGEDYYSCVFNDLGRVPEINNILINEYGLISELDEMIDFVNQRNRLRSLLRKGTFEEGDDYVIYRLWNGEFPLDI